MSDPRTNIGDQCSDRPLTARVRLEEAIGRPVNDTEWGRFTLGESGGVTLPTLKPRKLVTKGEVDFTARYDPNAAAESLTRLLGEDQTITVRYGRPFFLFPKQGMAWIVDEVVEFRGNLSSFEPVEAEGGSEEMSIGITLT